VFLHLELVKQLKKCSFWENHFIYDNIKKIGKALIYESLSLVSVKHLSGNLAVETPVTWCVSALLLLFIGRTNVLVEL